ncbi:MAG TPA: hypothetical protein PLZ57_06715 [Pseudobdellovibrionaceae bacterium]|nr:hypothetical protein [Pseudobdellovibrionaceae bacterium]
MKAQVLRLFFMLSALGPVASSHAATTCPPPRESLIASARSLRAQAQSICDRAEAEHLLALQSQDPAQAVRALQTWRQSGDTYRAAVEGLKLLRELRQSRSESDLRALRWALLHLSAQTAQTVDLEREATWLEWATGISRDSSGDARAFSLAHALEDADWSDRERRELRQQLIGLQVRVIQRELSIAAQHSARGRWIAALTRLEGVYRWPGFEQNPHIELILREALRMQVQLISDATLESREERAKLARSSAADTPSSAEIRRQLRDRACALVRHWRNTRSPNFMREDPTIENLCVRR